MHTKRRAVGRGRREESRNSVLSVFAFISVAKLGDGETFPWALEPHTWLDFPGLTIPFGILLDPLTAVMLITVAGVSLLVQIYSYGYMQGDKGFVRYYAYMSLFTASMLGLVLSRGVIQLYAFWELVGLSSYLLIGFWYTRPAAAAAAKKAFLMTRFGDFAFLLAILYLFTQGDRGDRATTDYRSPEESGDIRNQ